MLELTHCGVLLKGDEDWKLEDVRVHDMSKPASLASPRSDASSDADSAKWTLVSRLTSRLAEGQPAAEPSSSGRSTPSNLERAVLLLESEKDHDRAQAQTALATVPSKEEAGTKAKAVCEQEREEEALDFAASRASLKKLSTTTGALDEKEEEGPEEGPSTPPTGGRAARSSSIKADTPSSSAGVAPLLRICSEKFVYIWACFWSVC